MTEKSQSETDSEDALNDIPLTDTVDARRSNIKLSKEDEEKRICNLWFMFRPFT